LCDKVPGDDEREELRSSLEARPPHAYHECARWCWRLDDDAFNVVDSVDFGMACMGLRLTKPEISIVHVAVGVQNLKV